MKKTITIVGASAGVGLLCVRTALERGHQVRALARNTSSLSAHEHLSVIAGSATQLQDLRTALVGADAIIVTLGTGMDRKPTRLYTDFAATLLSLQSEVGRTPIQLLTGFGAGDSAQYQGAVARLLFRLLLKAVYENKSAMEQMIERSALNWSFVRPGMLTNRDTSSPARVQTDYRLGMKVGSVSRVAVARFLVEQAETPSYQLHKPALSAR